MYILLLVIVLGSQLLATPLKKHDTLEECVAQQIYMANEMHMAYPDDQDYFLVCRCLEGECRTLEGTNTTTP
jgi:hypothetical protein